MSAPPSRGRLAFGPFTLDLGRRLLSRDNGRVALGERALGVLVELASHPGETLDKDTLIERVWPDVGVSDEALSQAVHELRQALGDSPRAPDYVQTVHGRGYRFVGKVCEVPSSERMPVVRPAAVRRLVVVLAVVVLGGAAAGLWLLRLANSHPKPPERIEEVVRLPGGAFKPAISPDGRFVVVVSSDDAGNHSLFLVRPGLPSTLQLTRGVDVRGPAPTFSADGNWVFFTSYRSDDRGRVLPDVWRVPVLGGRPELVVEGASAAHQHWSGTRLVFSRVGPGGTSVVVREADGSEQEIAREGFWPRWSPDGDWVAYTTSDPEGGSGDLFVVRSNGNERRQLTHGPWQFYGLDWTARGEGVVFAAAREGPFQLWWVSKDGGWPVRLTVGARDDSGPVVAPDGSALLFVSGHMQGSLYVADGLLEPLHRVSGGGELVSVALDGTASQVAVVRRQIGGEGVLAVASLPGEKEVTVAGVEAVRARFRGDGRALLVVGAPAGGKARGLLQVDWPSGAVHTLVPDCGCDWPDARGDTLVFLRHEGEGMALVVRNFGRSNERVLLRRREIAAPRLSPDAHLVAWSGFLRTAEEASAGIWVAPVDGSGQPRRLAADGAWPVWEGKESLLFVRGANGNSLWRAAVNDGEAVHLRSLDTGFPTVAFDAGAGRLLAVGVHVDTPAVFAFHGLRLPR